MARTATTTDAFNAVAEASRRDLLDALGTGEATVGELVDRLGLSQPQVSKHLGVLRAVGLVLVRVDGRHRWYRVNGPALKPDPRLGAHVRAHLEHPSRPARRPARRAPNPGEQTMTSNAPSATATAPPSSPCRPTPRSSSPARSTLRPTLVFKAFTTPELVQAVVGLRDLGVARVRDRPAGRRHVALRHPRSATWRSASTASTARSTRPHRLVSTEVYEGVPRRRGRSTR